MSWNKVETNDRPLEASKAPPLNERIDSRKDEPPRSFDKSFQTDGSHFYFAGMKDETLAASVMNPSKHFEPSVNSSPNSLFGEIRDFDRSISKDFSKTPEEKQLVLQSAVNLEAAMLQDPNLAAHAQIFSEILKANQALASLFKDLPNGDRMMAQMLEAEKEAVANLNKSSSRTPADGGSSGGRGGAGPTEAPPDHRQPPATGSVPRTGESATPPAAPPRTGDSATPPAAPPRAGDSATPPAAPPRAGDSTPTPAAPPQPAECEPPTASPWPECPLAPRPTQSPEDEPDSEQPPSGTGSEGASPSSTSGGQRPKAPKDGEVTQPGERPEAAGGPHKPGAAVDGYRVKKGKIVDGADNELKATGIAIDGANALQDAKIIDALYPDTKVIRLGVGSDGSGLFGNGKLSREDMKKFIDHEKEQGRVVVIDVHSKDASNPGNAKTGAALDKELEFYKSIGEEYKDYPNVFIQTPNEPTGSHDQIWAEQEAIYDTVRSTGFKNPIIFESEAGWSTQPWEAHKDALKNKTNVLFDIHSYGGSTQTPEKDLQYNLNKVKSLITADGQGVGIIGECGNSVSGKSVDVNAGEEFAALSRSSAPMTMFWYLDHHGAPDLNADQMLDESGNPTEYGKKVQAFLAERR